MTDTNTNTDTVTIYDAVNPNNLPPGPVYLYYVDGAYQNYTAIKAKYPTATLLGVTVFGAANVRICDCESGDLTPQQAAQWAANEVAAKRRPTIYCNTSTEPAVSSALAQFNLSFTNQVDWYAAYYDDNPTIPSNAVAHQYQSTNYDTSIALSSWVYQTQPSPTPTPTEDNMGIYTQLFTPGESGTVPIPPLGPASQNPLGYQSVYVSISTDPKSSPSPTAYAVIGSPNTGYRAFNNQPATPANATVLIPTGRKLIISAKAGDEIVSITNNSNLVSITVMVEWTI